MKNPSFLVIVSIDLDRNLLLISVSLSPTIIAFLLLLENATHDLGIFTNPIALSKSELLLDLTTLKKPHDEQV
jgi:hypothetical protein